MSILKTEISSIHQSPSHLACLLMCNLPELLYSNLEKLEAICSAQVFEAIASMQRVTIFISSARGIRLSHCCKTSTHISRFLQTIQSRYSSALDTRLCFETS